MQNTKQLSKLSRIHRLLANTRSLANAVTKRLAVPLVLTVITITALDATAANAAVPASVPTDTNVGQFFGCLDVAFLKPLAPLSQNFSGKLVTIVVVLAMFFVLFHGAKLIFAGSRIDKAQDSIASLKNVFIGILVVTVGFAIILVAVPILFTGYCS